jgi:hypothetical protein
MDLQPGDLGWAEVFELSRLVRHGDLLECGRHGPIAALMLGTHKDGKAWTALHGDRLLGAFGWTAYGTIWSLWRDLTLGEAREVLRRTPQWVDSMVFQSGRQFLYNYVACDNVAALGWLRRSGSFAIDYNAVQHKGMDFPMYYFRTSGAT